MTAVPRVVIAAPSSGQGKTAVSVGLLAALRARDLRAVGFKVGPDYVDAGYLGMAAGSPGRNLDPRLMGSQRIGPMFGYAAAGADIAVIEGTMGLFDGLSGESDGESTAHIAGLLRAPVVLVIDTAAMGQSVAALVHGFRAYDELLWLGGVILGGVASDRHDQLLREALDDLGVPVFGAIRRRELPRSGLPPRSSGLVPVVHRSVDALRAIRRLGDVIAGSVDLDRVLALARSAPALVAQPWTLPSGALPLLAPRSRSGSSATGSPVTAELHAPASGALSAHPAPPGPYPPQFTGPVPPGAGTWTSAVPGHPAGPKPGSAGAPPTGYPEVAGADTGFTGAVPPHALAGGGGASGNAPGYPAQVVPSPASAIPTSVGPVSPSHPAAPGSAAPGMSVPGSAPPGMFPPGTAPVSAMSPVAGYPVAGYPGSSYPGPMPPVPVQPFSAGAARTGGPTGQYQQVPAQRGAAPVPGRRPLIVVAGSASCTYGYAEVPELLYAAGADVAFVDPLRDELLPGRAAGLVIGGGLPEGYLDVISGNVELARSVATFASTGRPVFAEGAGVAWLSGSFDGRPMCGVLDCSGRMGDHLVLGYREATVRSISPFLSEGTRIVGFKQHTGQVSPRAGRQPAWDWPGGLPEGFVSGNLRASYLCLHWVGVPDLASRLVAAAGEAEPLRLVS